MKRRLITVLCMGILVQQSITAAIQTAIHSGGATQTVEGYIITAKRVSFNSATQCGSVHVVTRGPEGHIVQDITRRACVGM